VPVDVVVPVYRDVAITMAGLEAVLRESGPALGRLVVVDDASPETEMAGALASLRDRDARVRVLTNRENRGFVFSANLGLSAGRGDVVLLNSDTEVTPGWLTELMAALAAEPRVAALSPLSNNATLCSVPNFMRSAPIEHLRGRRLELSKLPAVTPMPTAVGFCMAIRREPLDREGLFDLAYGRGYNEENDWCQRVRAAGWQVGRANRALVLHHGEVSFAGERARRDVVNARRLLRRYPRYIDENRSFEQSLGARVAARCVRAQLGLACIVQGPNDDPEVADLCLIEASDQPPRRVPYLVVLRPHATQPAAELTEGALGVVAYGFTAANAPTVTSQSELLAAAHRLLVAPPIPAVQALA
jgi:GT2 family glycosyltransferase